MENFWLPASEAKRRADADVDEALTPVDAGVPTEDAYRHEAVPGGLHPTADILAHPEEAALVYSWYAAAIARRNREPLAEDRFLGHFADGLSTDPTYGFGDFSQGFLMGFLKYGVFVPTHFAPKTMRGGYELMRGLGDSHDVPAVMSVTGDLTETLSKMPSWNKLELGFLAMFRDQLESKDVLYNSHPDTKNLMAGLIADYLAEAKERFSGEVSSDDWQAAA